MSYTTHPRPPDKHQRANLPSSTIYDRAPLEYQISLAYVGARLTYIVPARNLRECLNLVLLNLVSERRLLSAIETRVLDHDHCVCTRR